MWLAAVEKWQEKRHASNSSTLSTGNERGVPEENEIGDEQHQTARRRPQSVCKTLDHVFYACQSLVSFTYITQRKWRMVLRKTARDTLSYSLCSMCLTAYATP